MDTPTIAWLIAVLLSCIAVGFIVGLNFGEAHKRKMIDGVGADLTAKLREIQITLERVREHEQRAAGQHGGGGFDIRSADARDDAARAGHRGFAIVPSNTHPGIPPATPGADAPSGPAIS